MRRNFARQLAKRPREEVPQINDPVDNGTVPLNLNDIQIDDAKKLLVPRDIFASLPDKPWSRLRLEQGEVLKQWFDRRTERDLVIKQNTGGGKTVIGLLAVQSSLNEDVGPAVYLVPDTYLVRQVADEAEALGLAYTLDARDTAFRSSKAVLITTFDKLINGRSSFGVAGYKDTVRLGTIVVDDAHAALAAARNQFTVTIPASHPAYERLLGLFAGDLRAQNPKNFADLDAGDHCSPMRIPFWAWVDRQDRVLEVLRPFSDDAALKSLFFPWHLVAEHLQLTVATVSERVVEIRNPCPPINMLTAFAQAKRRIYLTATLADDGVLVTDLGADPDSVRKPITPERAADLGDRMILAPLALNPRLADDAVRQLARAFADGDRNGDGQPDADPVNVVVLVPSDRAAENWSEYADATVHVHDMKPVIDRMTDGEHVGLVLLVNKYDGVDLPGDACRLLVIDGVPTPLDASERRESAALAGSSTYLAREIQRLEQGMGRGIRDEQDHCAVLLLGRNPALALVEPESQSLFSPATRAQIALSRQVAEQIEGEGLDALRDALQTFLGRDEMWRTLSKRATAAVEYDREGHVTELAIGRRRAFDSAAVNDPATATSVLRNALDSVTDETTKGWYLEEVAAYENLTAPADAQRTLKAARTMNRLTLMPVVTLAPKPVKGHDKQAEAAAEYLAAQYSDAVTMQLKVGSILDDITWDEHRTDEAEDALRILGLHLGIVSSQPEREFGNGPDNHWALSASTNAIIEMKTGVTRKPVTIVKSEVDQLAGALNWDETNNPDATARLPVLVHPTVELDDKAYPPTGTRIIDPETLGRLKDAVTEFVNKLAAANAWGQPKAVVAALTAHGLLANGIIQRFSKKPTRL